MDVKAELQHVNEDVSKLWALFTTINELETEMKEIKDFIKNLEQKLEPGEVAKDATGQVQCNKLNLRKLCGRVEELEAAQQVTVRVCKKLSRNQNNLQYGDISFSPKRKQRRVE